MNCSSCGSQLPSQAKACPNCGALTPYYYSSSGGVSEMPTVTPTPTGSSPISSGADPYSDPLRNPYSSAPPPPPLYNTAPPASLPLTSPRRSNRTGVLIGAALLALIVLVGGFFAFPLLSGRTGPTAATSVPSSSSAASQKLNAPDAQKLYDQVTSGAPIIKDSMTQPDNYGWDDVADQNISCRFTDGTYHSAAKSGYVSLCYAEATSFNDFALQAQVTVSNGHSGGILFRGKSSSNSAYLFRISTDGTYVLKRVSANGPDQAEPTLLSGSSKAIVTGVNKPNLITAIVQKNNIYLYVNKKYLGSISDSTYQSGQIGVYADSDANSVEVVFSDVQVWKL